MYSQYGSIQRYTTVYHYGTTILQRDNTVTAYHYRTTSCTISLQSYDTTTVLDLTTTLTLQQYTTPHKPVTVPSFLLNSCPAHSNSVLYFFFVLGRELSPGSSSKPSWTLPDTGLSIILCAIRTLASDCFLT